MVEGFKGAGDSDRVEATIAFVVGTGGEAGGLGGLGLSPVIYCQR